MYNQMNEDLFLFVISESGESKQRMIEQRETSSSFTI